MKDAIKNQLALLNQQSKELSSIYYQAATRFGISSSEFWVLYSVLVLEGDYSQQDIADMWSLPKQTVNSVIKNLIQKDLIFLEAACGAKNRKVIKLTAAGKQFGEKTVMNIHEAEIRAFGGLSDQERKTYAALFDKYITLLQAATHEGEQENERNRNYQ